MSPSPAPPPELADAAASASAAPNPDAADWSERPEAGGARAATALVRIALRCGRRATRLLLWPATLYFAFRRPPDRRASRAYLTRVYGRPARMREVMRHMHTFAAMTLDRIFLLDERFKRFRIELHGIEHLVHALDQRRGVLLLGSHHGSFDALRVLSLQRPDVQLRVLLDVGHNPAMTTLLHELNPTLAGSVIDAGQNGTAILLAIKEGLDAQALVTLLADRPRPGETTVAATLLGEPAAFPAAPWLIASACGVPVVLCFGLYRGGNRYDLHFELYADRVEIPRRERQAALATLVQRYAGRLEHYIRLAPYNWFNFYDFWLSERVRARLAALLLALAPSAQGAELELDALLARLARPAPSTTPFVEVRWSALLKTPLVSSGTLEYRGPDALARHVVAPYREDTEIAAGEARVAREGRRPQRFSLARAPELHGLLTGFSALLGGDRVALEREFEVGVELGREGWTLVLTPHAERARKRIGRIAIEGRGSEPRCFAVDGAGGSASLMLLGAAAQAPLPEPIERAALERRCAAGE